MQVTAAEDFKTLYEQQLCENNELKIAFASLQQQLSQLQKMIFGSRHERFIPSEVNTAQLSLDIQADGAATCSIADAKKITYTRTNISVEQKSLQHPGRMKLPEYLRREKILIEPDEDITFCKKMGEEITEVLEYEPGDLFVKKYVRIKYAKPDGEGVLIGRLPSRPLEKAMAGAGLLAQIVIDKYVDHLPLHKPGQRRANRNT
jgi:transposase